MNENYNPIFLNIGYMYIYIYISKNGKIQQTRVIIPFVLFKTIELYKVDPTLYPNHNE